jgi:hypothetical protein
MAMTTNNSTKVNAIRRLMFLMWRPPQKKRKEFVGNGDDDVTRPRSAAGKGKRFPERFGELAPRAKRLSDKKEDRTEKGVARLPPSISATAAVRAPDTGQN